jgi:hypothetical protein
VAKDSKPKADAKAKPDKAAASHLAAALGAAIKEAQEAARSGDLARLRETDSRQALEMSMMERQARVAQELALAERIRSAGEFQIEEFYDTSADATAGPQAAMNAGTEQPRVVRRTYWFKTAK